MEYKITELQKHQFIGLVLLNEIINFQTYFPVFDQENIYLRDYLSTLKKNEMIKVVDDKYVPTEKGREYVETFYKKYYEYLKMFDIFCAVDLEKGEFAFSHILDENFDDESWNDLINEERFSDLRVAVAEFKKIDAMEIVFMSFLNEGRFDCTVAGWQQRLTQFDVWEEIENICNTAVSSEYLIEEGVIEDVIVQGTEIAMEIIKKAEESLENVEEYCETYDEEIIETTTTEYVEEYVDVVEMPCYGYDYWDPYYDPYYVSPLWLVPAAIILF